MNIVLRAQELVDAVGCYLEHKKLIDTNEQNVTVNFKAKYKPFGAADFWADVIIEDKVKAAGEA